MFPPAFNQVFFGFLDAGENFPEEFLVLRLVKVILKALPACQRRECGGDEGCSLHRLVAQFVLLVFLRVAAPKQLVVLHLQGAVLGVNLVEQRDPAIFHYLGPAHAGALVVIDPVRRVWHLRRLHQPLTSPALQDRGAFSQRCLSVILLLWVEEHCVWQQAVEDVWPVASCRGF